MTPTKIYIAGPMTGKPDENFPAFFAAGQRLQDAGYATINPASHGHSEPGKDRAWFMRRDIPMLLEADAIVMLPGWEESIGASLEYHIAQVLGLEIIDLKSVPD